MFKVNPSVRITLGLVLITISILLLVDLLGLLPDRKEAVIEGRKALAESLAIQYSVAAQKRDIDSIKASMRILVKRNPDVLSAALRTSDGRLLAVSGDHEFSESETTDAESSATHARVPIFRGSQQWGQVEISFLPVAANKLLGYSISPLVSMIGFISILGFASFLFFIRKTHQQIDPDAVVPKRVKYALDALAEGVLLLDDHGRIMMANSAFAELVGMTPKKLMGRNASKLGWNFVNSKETELPWVAAIRLGESQTGKHLRITNKAGEVISLVINCAPVKDSEGDDRGVMATFDDVTQLEEKNDQLEEMLDLLKKSRDEVKRQNDTLQVLATRDSLTNCLNRRSFFEKYDPVFNTAKRENHDLSCIMLDIDHFKSINDNYGHAMGDEAIRVIGEILHTSFRSTDTVCRYGGEEFCIALPGMNLGDAIKAAERARSMIESQIMPGLPEMKITASLGVSCITLGADSLLNIIDEADKALYTSKNRGRNCVTVWASGEEKIQMDTQAVEADTTTGEATTTATITTGQSAGVPDESCIPSDDTALKTDHDTLTGLPNRNLFHEQVSRALAHCRKNNLYACVLMLDLDMFKRVNNALGYSVGDRLLKVVSERLASMLRNTDTVSRLDGGGSSVSIYRLGGDEFGILLSEMDCSEFIPQIVKRIIKYLSERIDIDEHEIYMTCSVGISLFPGDSVDTDTILKHASTALFHAKAHGHNNYLFYHENLSKNSFENMKLESDLRHAIEDEELILYYQPKVDLGSGKVTGMEALLRWQHPEVGMIPPDEFIPIAESTGLIIPMGKWVMRTACDQIRAWEAAGYGDISISVNLSAVQFKQEDLLQQINEILDETGVVPHMLEMEITENTIMDDIGNAAATLRELHKTGVQISIDDFGTGYSSLSYLKRFPINTVKIDRAFIRDITTDTHDAAIVRAVLTMAHNMGLRVVAEGIETVAQLDYLRELECDEIQGFLFSPPVPYKEAEAFLKEGKGLSEYLTDDERAVS